jgi:hypothetical protein
MTEGTPQKFKITKRFNHSIKTADGGILSFATELSTDVEVSSGEQLVAESSKLFAQAKYLTDEDINKTFGESNNG